MEMLHFWLETYADDNTELGICYMMLVEIRIIILINVPTKLLKS